MPGRLGEMTAGSAEDDEVYEMEIRSAAPSVNGANDSASDMPRVAATRSMFWRLMFCSPRSIAPM